MARQGFYRMEMDNISRSQANGGSVVNAAAYRSASSLHDERRGKDFDYSQSADREGLHSEIMLPAGAPDWMANREQLWNHVEAIEKRADSRLARDVTLSIPKEFNREQGIDLVRDYAQKAFVDRGMVADLNVHYSHPDNPHAHILLSTREVGENGFENQPKQREWERRQTLVEWRQEWEHTANLHAERAGIDMTLDRRPIREQQHERPYDARPALNMRYRLNGESSGIDKIPPAPGEKQTDIELGKDTDAAIEPTPKVDPVDRWLKARDELNSANDQRAAELMPELRELSTEIASNPRLYARANEAGIQSHIDRLADRNSDRGREQRIEREEDCAEELEH